MINNSGSIMKSHVVGGHIAEVGTVISYVAIPRLHTTTGGERVKLIALCGDSNGIRSKQDYPQDQWDEYCMWVKANVEPRQTRFLVYSPFWHPSRGQHKQLLKIAMTQEDDKKTYLSAVVGNETEVSLFQRIGYRLAATACRLEDGIPIKFIPDGNMLSALEYMKISDRHLTDIEDALEDLQRAIDRRNGRPLET